MAEEIKFVFVGGAPRSGTTLMQRMLTRHSLIAGGGEFQSNKDFVSFYLSMSRRLEFQSNEYYTEKDLTDRFMRFYEGFFQRVLSAKPAARWISEKSTSNIEVARKLLDVFPGSRFIHMVRDGRDVLASSLEVRERAVAKLKEASSERTRRIADFDFVRESLRASHHASSVHRSLRDDPRYLAVRYEDVVEAPEREMLKVFSFLGIPFEPSTLDVHDGSKAALRVDEIYHKSEDATRSIDKRGLSRFRSDLKTRHRLMADVILGEDLVEFRYPTDVLAQAGRTSRKIMRGLKHMARRRARRFFEISVFFLGARLGFFLDLSLFLGVLLGFFETPYFFESPRLLGEPFT